MLSFIRPIGVHRDINELEYISALLQSNQHVIRTSGTIVAADIAIYLKSRHGLIVSEEIIDRLILLELAGQIQDEPIKEILHTEPKKKKKKVKNTDVSEEQVVRFAMDISQITAILLIPELIEASESRDMNIFAPFRDVILAYTKDGQITGPILREIFASVNEFKVSDEVITEMLKVANRPESLIHALVSDVALYKDHSNVSKAPTLVEEISDPSNNDLSIKSVFTAPFIDSSADTLRRPSFGMQLWTTGIAAYFAYVRTTDGLWITAKCNSDSIRCSIASGLATWLSIFLQIVALGVPYIILGSLSNANYPKLYRFPALLIGMATVFLVTIPAYRYSVKTDAFDTSGNKDKHGIDVCNGDAACIEACTQNPDECHEDYIIADDFAGSSYFLALILGCTILLSQVVDLILQLTPQRWLDDNGLLQRLVLPGTLRQERAGHQAAKLRIEQFLTNALEIFNDKSLINSLDSDNLSKRPKNALERFLLLPVKTETVGGVLWAWKRVWDGTIFCQEGIWLNSRLLACNFSQVMVFGLLVFFTRVLYYKQQEFFYSEEELEYQTYLETQKQVLFNGNYTDGFRDDISKFFNCTKDFLPLDAGQYNSGGFVDFTQPKVFIPYLVLTFGSYEAAREALNVCYEAYATVAAYLDESHKVLTYKKDVLKNLVVDLYISPSEFIAAAWCGLLVGFSAVTYIAVIFIPSFVSTVMKYRSGVKPTLKNPEFLRYRYAMDSTTALLGSAFWGCFFTATGAFVFFVFLILFFGILPLILGTLQGFLVIMLIKLFVLFILRSAFFSAFYRRKPGAANLMFAVLEVWNIALTLGFVFIRAVNVVLVSILYIARIDTPFLAPGVGRFGSLELDAVAITFEKDLLIHESHRHMLIERLGLLYVIKLHSADTFASRAGSAWRLLFVLISMPWLQKYRISRNAVDLDEMIAHLEEDLEDESDVFDHRRQELKISELKSQKAVATAEKGTVAEIKALHKRIAYLEEKNRFYEQYMNTSFLEKVDLLDRERSASFEVPVVPLPKVKKNVESTTNNEEESLPEKESTYYEV